LTLDSSRAGTGYMLKNAGRQTLDVPGPSAWSSGQSEATHDYGPTVDYLDRLGRCFGISGCGHGTARARRVAKVSLSVMAGGSLTDQ
jgi:hypothetical protein